MSSRAARKELQRNLLLTLYRLSCSTHPNNISQSYETWPSTRQLAESCNVSIYQARNLLLELVRQGDILVTPLLINKSLRWYPARVVYKDLKNN
ncbi:FaeA/PapI family transcriptional regulator [Serratia ureilytica]|uniref:FaeA/PapI family transcriptional regulator n=1 Tax=Serratia ureilytica TaxID=300181 RepID=UPI000B8ECEB7|nr:FaeA/PapI family transcriptional regulator [Serratia ureilytica]MEB5992007.1 FaeA/PapI family transcriptional regulator [Serratia ureilytica]